MKEKKFLSSFSNLEIYWIYLIYLINLIYLSVQEDEEE